MSEGVLTKKSIDSLEKRDKKYRVRDSDGLLLVVYPSGTKQWVVRMYINGKPKETTIGDYPDMSPTAARKERSRMKSDREKLGNAATTTLGELCERWLRDHSMTCAPATQYNHKLYISYMEPLLKTKIADLKRLRIIDVLDQVHHEKSYDAARRTATCLSQVLQHAVNLGLLEFNPASGIRSAISATREERKGKHFDAITDLDGIKRLLDALDLLKLTKPVEYTFLRLISYTFVRSSELRLATWSEVDIENKIWSIPAEHTKRRKSHVVPLSAQVLALLERQRRCVPHHSDAPIVPSDRTGQAISRYTPIAALKTLQTLPEWERPGKMTVHGFRAMASTVLNESRLWTPDAIERQLSHSPEDDVRAAYNRGEYWDERVRMMQWYADKLDEIKSGKTG